MSKFLICILSISSICVSASNFKGPFKAEAIAFYIVHKGGPLNVSANISADKDKQGKVVCRFFDANEELVKWDYGKIAPGKTVIYKYNFGKNAPRGIYQVRYSGKNILVNLKSTPENSFGIMPQRCMLNSTSRTQFKQVYFYIPPGFDEFSIRGFGIKAKISDAGGRKVVAVTSKAQKVDVKGKSGQVWQLSLDMIPKPYCRFGVSGMPLILCPDEASAKAIAGSVEKTSDGKYFAHKFQVKMYDWIKSLTQKDLELDVVDIRKDKTKLEEDELSGALFGRWGYLEYLPYTLRFQNIDPKSKDFGKGGEPSALAIAYALDKTWNPYYHNKIIEKRMLLAQFQRLINLKENGTREENDNTYCGLDALYFLQFPSTSFYFAGKDIQDKKLAKLWSGAIRRIPDRFSMFRVSCDNQSSHWPVAYLYMARGSGEEGYKELAKDYISGLSLPKNNKFMKTGYQQEAYGPDATYQGLGACYQALYYRITGDENAKKGLSIIYNLFNHTVAPEPDSEAIYGASNFSHRTAGSWVRTQYGAGRQFMKHELESAAVWYRNRNDFDYKAELTKAFSKPARKFKKSKRNDKVNTYSTFIISSLYSNYLYPSKRIKGAKFPVEKSDNFTRNFNNEFIAVRRPAYYAMVYTGKTASKWTRSKVRFNPKSKNPIYKWNQTQGLGMMWTPEFGNCILGMNWNADTAQMVRADISDDKCDFPDYWSLENGFNQNSMTLTMNWKMFKLPVNICRKITFSEESVKVKIRLFFSADCKVMDMYEQLPFLQKPGLKIVFKSANGKWQNELCKTNEVKFVNAANIGILFRFKKAREFAFGKNTNGRLDKTQKMGVLKVKLGSTFKKGSLARMQYEMIPFK